MADVIRTADEMYRRLAEDDPSAKAICQPVKSLADLTSGVSRARCPNCGKRVPLRPDGTFRTHKERGMKACFGSGTRP